MFKNFFQMWENNLQYFCENNFFQEIFFSRFFWNFLSNIFAKKIKNLFRLLEEINSEDNYSFSERNFRRHFSGLKQNSLFIFVSTF